MFPIRMRQLDNISVRKTYRWKARLVAYGDVFGFNINVGVYEKLAKQERLFCEISNASSSCCCPCCDNQPLPRPPTDRQLHTVFPLIEAGGSDGIFLIQAGGFYYRKYGIHEWMSVAHCPQHSRNAVPAMHAYATIEYASVGTYLSINTIRI